jgi:hypothetical protein
MRGFGLSFFGRKETEYDHKIRLNWARYWPIAIASSSSNAR